VCRPSPRTATIRLVCRRDMLLVGVRVAEVMRIISLRARTVGACVKVAVLRISGCRRRLRKTAQALKMGARMEIKRTLPTTSTSSSLELRALSESLQVTDIYEFACCSVALCVDVTYKVRISYLKCPADQTIRDRNKKGVTL
jgi:hypothetical protein